MSILLDLPRKIVILIYSVMLSLRLVFIHFYQRIQFILLFKSAGIPHRKEFLQAIVCTSQ